MLSSFSLISLVGVMLGVLALVVVMAVFSGLERNMKERLLGSTPHVLLRSLNSEFRDGRMSREVAEEAMAMAKKLPSVETATAFVAGNAMIDAGENQPYVSFRGIDTSDPGQTQGISKMLDLEKYPDSTADLGLDDRAVISSFLAEQLEVGVGAKIGLISTANAKTILSAYKSTQNPPVREAYPEIWKKTTGILEHGWKRDGDKFTLPTAEYRDAYEPLFNLLDENIRSIEHDSLNAILLAMDQSEQAPDGEVFSFDASSKEQIAKAISDINSTDRNAMDLATYKSLDSLVLPKEVVVAGIYQASQMTVTPDVFIPLPLAQHLAGLDDAVQGISLRLQDPYKAEIFATEGRKTLGEDWSLVTWGQQYQQYFTLIEQQRAMMYFVLVFIMLVSAFSIMAVMFTITIQKKREIGVMKALGAAPGQIARVFLYQGMILGTLGAGLGVVFGRIVIYFRGELQDVMRAFGFDPFTAQFLGFHKLPAYNNPWEQAVFALVAFLLCSLAALVPAFYVARSDAAKSLRNL